MNISKTIRWSSLFCCWLAPLFLLAQSQDSLIFTKLPSFRLLPVSGECKILLHIEQPEVKGAKAYLVEIFNATTQQKVASSSIFPYERDFAKVDFADYILHFIASDNIGNQGVVNQIIAIKDTEKPKVTCEFGLSADILPTTGTVALYATAFKKMLSDNCSSKANISLKIENGKYAFSNNGLAAKDTIVIGCVGIMPIRLWATDEYGNQDYCDTYIDIQNNMGAIPRDRSCVHGDPICDFPSLYGVVMTPNGKGLEKATVIIKSSKTATEIKAIVTNGAYHALVGAADITCSASKDDDPLNGVSTFDLHLMSKHILGTQTITDAYAKIAADVNNDGKITTADVVELRKMILGLQKTFSKSNSWRFFDKNGSDKPILLQLDKDTKIDFIGVKIGDINGNAKP
jgi:Dockerin type I domain